MNNRISIVILGACIFFTHWCARAIEESELVGSWQTAEDSPSTYDFAKDHTVAERWVPNDQPMNLRVIQFALRVGHWTLDGEQLVIIMDSETGPDSSGKGTTVQLSSEEGTTSWTIVYDTRYKMIWSTTTTRAGVWQYVELKLRRTDGPLIAVNRG